MQPEVGIGVGQHTIQLGELHTYVEESGEEVNKALLQHATPQCNYVVWLKPKLLADINLTQLQCDSS